MACALLLLTAAPHGAAGVTLKLTLHTLPKGDYNGAFNFLTTFPLTVDFLLASSTGGSTYLWQFGDGTNSSDPAPVHTYTSPFVYEVHVSVTGSNGTVSTGSLEVGAFDTRGRYGRGLGVYPPAGTAGFIPVAVSGAYFNGSQPVTVFLNGTRLQTVRADSSGDWTLDVTGYISEKPNGTEYVFTTSPPSLVRSFTTLEGVRSIPASGVAGDSVLVEGRSYAAYSSVLVYLGGVSLGTAQTDGNGSFLEGFQVPSTAPLTSPGTYGYATFPAISGTQASFTVTGFAVLGVLLSPSWWWALLVIPVVALLYLWRRRRRRTLFPPA